MKCPRCQTKKKQCKVGFNQSGGQKYCCYECGKNYTPEPKVNGYAPEIRLKAIKLYLEGNSFRSIQRLLNVNHQSVANWIKKYSEQLPKVKLPENLKWQNWTNFSPLLARKKRNLHHHDSGSGFSMYFELGCCQGKKFCQHASLP